MSASMESELEPGFRALAVFAAALGAIGLADPSPAVTVNTPISAPTERCAKLPQLMSGRFPDASTHLTAAGLVGQTAIQAGGAGGPDRKSVV